MSVNLTKWPGLLVVGESITADQAKEVLIRTGGVNFNFSSNDKPFEKALLSTVGVELDERGFEIWDTVEAAQRKYGTLDLEYLGNHRVLSSWIGGPHGWCDWNGNIGCSTFNIGKWPDSDEILREWKLIAETFPFLTLKSQLLRDEIGETSIPVVEYTIANGQVEVDENPLNMICRPFSLVDHVPGLVVASLLAPGRERGCTLDRLKDALEVTVQSLALKAGNTTSWDVVKAELEQHGV